MERRLERALLSNFTSTSFVYFSCYHIIADKFRLQSWIQLTSLSRNFAPTPPWQFCYFTLVSPQNSFERTKFDSY